MAYGVAIGLRVFLGLRSYRVEEEGLSNQPICMRQGRQSVGDVRQVAASRLMFQFQFVVLAFGEFSTWLSKV